MGSFTSDFFKNNKAESSSTSSSKKKKKKKNEIDVNNFTDSFFSNYGDDDLKVLTSVEIDKKISDLK